MRFWSWKLNSKEVTLHWETHPFQTEAKK